MQLSDGGRTLRLVVQHGVGDQIESADIREEPDHVEVKVYVRTPPPEVTRILVLIGSETAVELAEPLGDRELRHGPTDYPGWPRRVASRLNTARLWSRGVCHRHQRVPECDQSGPE